MKIRAILTIDIEASDFVDAAEHQRRVEALLSQVSAVYPSAALTFRERRVSARDAGPRPAGQRMAAPVQATGRLSSYVD
jgi:hypothetical protein